MAVNLQLVEWVTPTEKAISNLLKATLEYPASSPAKAKKLADDITFICTSAENNSPPFWEIWPAVIGLASRIPSGHEWQISLVESVHLLRQLGDSVAKDDFGDSLNKLPYLSITIAEYWNGLNNPDCLESSSPLGSDQLNDMLEKWKNMNSFLARTTRDDFIMMLYWGIGQLINTLEEPPIDQDLVATCYIWVATEWITHCGRLIFEAVALEGVSEIHLEALEKGSLCRDMPLQSIQRWEFWKERLSQMGGDSITTSRIQEAIVIMNDIEQRKI